MTLLWSSRSEAVFDFDVTFCASGCDYTTPALAEAALDDAGSISDTTTKCGAWDAQSGTIADATAVTWDAGASSGTLHHMTDAGSSGEYMLEVAAGTLDDNDIVSDGTNTFTLSGEDDSCSVTIRCAENGTFTNISIDGFTTDIDNKVYLTVDSAYRHNGTGSTGCLLSGTTGTISLSDPYTSAHWFRVTCSQSNAANLQCVSFSNAFGNWGMYVDKLIIYDGTNAGTGYMSGINLNHSANTGNPTNYVTNTIVENCDGQGILLNTSASGIDVEIYNSTFLNNDQYGIPAGGSGIQNIRNNIACGNAAGDYGGTYDSFVDSGSCDTSGSEAGLQSLSATTEFIDSVSDPPNLHLKAGATSINSGTDYTTSPTGVNFDIDNYDRDAGAVVWDIGADECQTDCTAGGWVTVDSVFNDLYVF